MKISFAQPLDDKYDFLISYHIDLIEKFQEQKEHLKNKIGFYSENGNIKKYNKTLLMMNIHH